MDVEVANSGHRSRGQREVMNKKPHVVSKHGASANIKNPTIPHDLGSVGRRRRVTDGRIYGCESEASGMALLPGVPEFQGCHTAAETRREAGWEHSSFWVLLLPEEAALKSGKSVRTGCVQSVREGEEIPGGRQMRGGGAVPSEQSRSAGSLSCCRENTGPGA